MDNLGMIKRGHSLGKKCNKKYILRECLNCGEKKWVQLSNIQRANYAGLCTKCFTTRRGSNHTSWKGGKIKKVEGYIEIYAPDHPLASKNRRYVYEHRIVAAEKYGIFAVMESHVHHIDGNKGNNDPDNLELVKDNAHHRDKHRDPNSDRQRYNEENYTIICECNCGSELLKYDNSGRPRRYVSGHQTKRMKIKICRWCSTTEPTDEPYKGFCSHDCWYEAMGHWDGWDKPEEIEEDEVDN